MKDLRKGKVSSGLVLCIFLSLPLILSSSGFCQDDYVFVLMWGTFGSGDGQFDRPHGIAVDSEGNVYVADTWNTRIQIFNSSGGFITEWPNYGLCHGVAVDSSGNVYFVNTSLPPMIWKFDSSGGFITRWGGFGQENGKFSNPYGIAVDSEGNVYVADTYNHRIQKFNSSGGFITSWGSQGDGDGQFKYPSDVAVNSKGNVFVADWYNYRIQKFNSIGDFITKWGSGGNGDGEFINPYGIAVDLNGNVYVADTYNYRIQKFAPNTSIDIQTILSFFDECVENARLIGSGPGNSWHRMKALRNMLKSAGELVEDGLTAEACQQLLDAYKRCDGQPKPPDFVEGFAAPQLAEMIQKYRAYLGCNP